MIDMAAKIAENSDCRVQHGAVIAKGSRVFGMGCNSYKEHPTWGGGVLMTLHAEAAAIRDAVRKGINLKGKNLYVTRVNATSKMSRPCSSCRKLIREHGIRKVYYTDRSGRVVDEYP